MPDQSLLSEMGIGATDTLSLRVSVATLIRVLFEHPGDGTTMLALERKATVLERESGDLVGIKSQPFGGAIQILDVGALQERVGRFHFDSEESRDERDFRIFIQPVDWEVLQEFCLEHLSQPNDTVLESGPKRELVEEFAETIGIDLKPDQYTWEVIGTVIEAHPSPTENIHARGYRTARMYRLYEARLYDPVIIAALIENSTECSDEELLQRALERFQESGSGRANAVLTLPFGEVNAFYAAIPPERRNQPILFQNHQLDETVAGILPDLPVRKYRRV